ncbi:MAG TPA: MmgE/PrpD family protein [Casimicrobiaceae bacterium]|nr:MmgE/PrpD family protein [Casimicrobiaceae bacterium]
MELNVPSAVTDEGNGPNASTPVASDVCGFVSKLAFEHLPADVVAQARRCLLDLIGVAAAGSRTPSTSIVNAFTAAQLGGRDAGARVLFDGRRVGVAGAAFAGAATIDSFDAHDGHMLTKGHMGVAVLPALLAYIDGDQTRTPIDGREFITCLVLGYEIATRAGIALHATTADYHCSGAWNSLACAAIGARLLRLDRERLRHALGIAEYFGPRGQILRVCDTPTMMKDGSSFGALAGVSAALLARDGFTGAPALTVEADDVRDKWSDLSTRWRIREQYFKPYPVCHWAQQAIAAALALKRAHGFAADDVRDVTIESFAEAVALGAGCELPRNTEEAQYSLAFPVAAALVFGRVAYDEINAPGLGDPRVARLCKSMTMIEEPAFSRAFPAERWARVRITLNDGRTLVSEPAQARGIPTLPLSPDELLAKYRELATPVLGAARASRIESLVDALTRDDNAASRLIDELLSSVG